jgi:hypothetical protein
MHPFKEVHRRSSVTHAQASSDRQVMTAAAVSVVAGGNAKRSEQMAKEILCAFGVDIDAVA